MGAEGPPTVVARGDRLAGFFEVVLPYLDKLQGRVVAGAMAQASGMSRNTVSRPKAN